MFQTSFFAVGLKTSEWTVSRKKQKVGPDTEEAGRNKTKQEHTQHQRSKITLRFLFCVYKYSRKLLYLYGVCVFEGAEVTYPRWPEFLGGSMSWSEPQRDGADGARVPPMVLKPCLLLYLAWLTLVEVGRIGEPDASTCKFRQSPLFSFTHVIIDENHSGPCGYNLGASLELLKFRSLFFFNCSVFLELALVDGVVDVQPTGLWLILPQICLGMSQSSEIKNTSSENSSKITVILMFTFFMNEIPVTIMLTLVACVTS